MAKLVIYIYILYYQFMFRGFHEPDHNRNMFYGTMIILHSLRGGLFSSWEKYVLKYVNTHQQTHISYIYGIQAHIKSGF